MLSASTVRARRGQSAGYGVVYRRRGWLLRVGRRGRCAWASTGTAAGAGVLSRPRSPMGALWSASAWGGGSGEVGEVSVLQVGSWCTSWAAARRWLGVGGGWSEREGESVILAKIASGSPLLLCPTTWDKEKMSEG
jgi:hypothetical protein